MKQLKELANTNKKEAFENKNEKELYQNQVADLINRLNQIENENKFKYDLKKYEDDKAKYINDKWAKKSREKWEVKWLLLAWVLAFSVLYVLFSFIDEKSQLKFFKQNSSFITFLISTSLSIFLNKDAAIFSFRYIFSRRKIEKQYKNIFKEEFESKNSTPKLN